MHVIALVDFAVALIPRRGDCWVPERAEQARVVSRTEFEAGLRQLSSLLTELLDYNRELPAFACPTNTVDPVTMEPPVNDLSLCLLSWPIRSRR